MKNNLKKISAFVIMVLMLTSNVFAGDGLPIGTYMNFNDQSGVIKLWHSNGNYYIRDNTKPNGERFSYAEALGGRKAGDWSYSAYWDNFNNAGGINRIQDQFIFMEDTPIASQEFIDSKDDDGNYNESLRSAVTLEFSMMATGAFDKYKMLFQGRYDDGTTGWNENFFVMYQSYIDCNGTKISYTPGRWVKVAMTFYSNNNIDVWVDGIKVVNNAWIATKRHMISMKQARIQADNWGSALNPRYLALHFDDVSVQEGTYNSIADSVIYSVKSDKIVDLRGNNALLLTAETTVDELKTALTTNSYSIYSDSALSTELTDGVIPEGAYLVMQSENQKMLKYIKITYDTSIGILTDLNFDDENGIPVYDLGENTSLAYEGGLFTKAVDNKAFVINSTAISDVWGNGRYSLENGLSELNDSNWNDPNISKPVITMEFSAAVSGDIGMMLAGRPGYVNKENYNEEIRGSKIYFQINDNGKAYLGDSGIAIGVCKNEWIRVAMTIYPAEMKYDMWINGDKVMTKADLDDTYNDTALYDYRGFNWISVRGFYGSYKEGNSGKVALDDYKVYYGAYGEPESDKVTMDISYPTNINGNIMYTDDTDVGDFAGNIEYSAAEAVMYTDNTYTETASELGNGTVIVLTSESGLVKKYYYVKPATETVDEKATFSIEGTEANIIKAEINAYAPSINNKKATFVLAVYEDGKLKSAQLLTNDIVDETSFELSYNVAENENVTAKAMLFESLTNLKPLAGAASLLQAE